MPSPKGKRKEATEKGLRWEDGHNQIVLFFFFLTISGFLSFSIEWEGTKAGRKTLQ